MSKIQREEFLNKLEMVKSGLSPREFIEQSSCFCFQGGSVYTFNDEVACQMEIGADITGAVQATALLDILGKLKDEELAVEENKEGELEFIGKRKRFGLTKEAEIFLPIDRVEVPEKWRPLPKEFTEAVAMVQHCVSTDESKFLLTCIHISPEFVESCDNFQVMRCALDLGLKGSVLVRGSSLKDLATLAMSKVALTKTWIHFKNEQGLVYSCRRYVEDYPNLDDLMECKGHSIALPKSMGEASERAAVFAVDPSGETQVRVSLVEGKVRVRGEGVQGWYQELSKVAYDGPPLDFLISPVLFKQICQNHSQATISKDRLSVTGAQWTYVTILGRHEKEKADKAKKEKEAEEEKE